jgi:hypothetical protein
VRRTRAQVLAWCLFAVPVALVPFAIAIVAASGASWGQDVTTAPLLVLGFSGVGLLVVRGDSRNAVGWLLLAIGLTVGIHALTTALVGWDELRDEPIRGASLNAIVHSTVQIVALGVLIPRVLLVFPTGRPPTPRWRVVGWAQLVVLATLLAGVFLPGVVEGYERAYENPLGVDALEFLSSPVVNVPVVVCFVFGALGSVSSGWRGASA